MPHHLHYHRDGCIRSALYSLDANLDLGTKYAFKDKHEILTSQSGEEIPVDSKISLYGLNASYRVMKDWDVTCEYHLKRDSTYDELEQGALVSVNKHLGDNFKVGVGYNFSGFDGNLANDDDYDASGVFINLVGKL